MFLNLAGKLFSLDKPQIWGILNLTPDSFFDGGHYIQEKAILQRAEQILTEGAMLIDVGGYSSRPNAQDISVGEELTRVLPAIRSIKKHFPEALISIDTFRAEVARQAVGEGACLVNDISGGALDTDLWRTVGELRVPYLLMHMRGSPQTMQSQTHYEDVVKEVYFYFSEKIAQLRSLKQHDIILDLGFGFAKTVSQSFELLKNLDFFHTLDLPILVGVSRKSMIYKTLQIEAEQALNGTTVLNTIALAKKAQFLRVHDVKEAMEAVKLVELLND